MYYTKLNWIFVLFDELHCNYMKCGFLTVVSTDSTIIPLSRTSHHHSWYPYNYVYLRTPCGYLLVVSLTEYFRSFSSSQTTCSDIANRVSTIHSILVYTIYHERVPTKKLWATRRNIPEDGILHSHRRENLISYILYFLLPKSMIITRCYIVDIVLT
jgi:hypothetical protein